jgi:uncharacterized sporulation protein YeaH/YhbH (DUF444 family)
MRVIWREKIYARLEFIAASDRSDEKHKSIEALPEPKRKVAVVNLFHLPKMRLGH